VASILRSKGKTRGVQEQIKRCREELNWGKSRASFGQMEKQGGEEKMKKRGTRTGGSCITDIREGEVAKGEQKREYDFITYW